MIYQMEACNLNFYSKYSLARQKKNISSLYELISDNKNNVKSASSLHFKLTIQKESKYGDIKKQYSKNFSQNELLQSFAYLRQLHDSQRRQFLQNTDKQQLKRYASLTESEMSKASHQLKRQTCYLPNQQINNQQIQQHKQEQDKRLVCSDNKNYYSMNIQQALKTNLLQRLQLHQSIIEQRPQLNNKQTSQNQQFLPIFPSQQLQPQVESKATESLPLSCINKNIEQQLPDKVSRNDVSHDQQDFEDIFTPPIKKSAISGVYQQIKTPRKDRIQSLKSILIEFHQQNQPQPMPQSQIQENSIVLEKIQQKAQRIISNNTSNINEDLSVIKPKKKNFKAMMAKNKSQEVKNERNKKLLLNFFDQN